MRNQDTDTALAVAIPAWGSAHLLERCLKSIALAGHSAVLQVSVVLDGPDEDLEAVLANWKPPSDVNLVYAVGNAHGIGATRNAAVEQTSAPFITLLDMDDELEPRRLQWFQENVASLDTQSIYIGEQELDGERVVDPGKWTGARERHVGIHLSTMVMSRQVWESLGGFDPTMGLSDDWDFVVRARSQGIAIMFVDEVFVRRHIGAHNASHDHARLRHGYIEGIRRNINRKQ